MIFTIKVIDDVCVFRVMLNRATRGPGAMLASSKANAQHCWSKGHVIAESRAVLLCRLCYPAPNLLSTLILTARRTKYHVFWEQL